MDALLEGARLGGGVLGRGEGLGLGGASGHDERLHVLLPGRHLADLAAGGEEPLHLAPALDHRAPQGLAAEGGDRHRPLARDHLEGVLQGLDDEGVGEGGADAVGLGPLTW